MSVRIVCVKKDYGNHLNPHEGITHYGWIQKPNEAYLVSERQQMVDWVRNGGLAYVEDTGGNKAYCYIKRSSVGNEFLQTESDGKPTNNLLQLFECR